MIAIRYAVYDDGDGAPVRVVDARYAADAGMALMMDIICAF